MDLLRDPIWQFIGVIVAIFLGVSPFIYRTFKRRKRKAGVDFIVKDSLCHLTLSVGNDLPGKQVFIDDGFHLDISGHLDVVVNDTELADAYLRVYSVDSNWDLDLTVIKKSEVRVEVPKPDYIFENPVILTGRNTIPNCRFSVVLPIKLLMDDDPPHPFRILGMLKKFSITIAADLKDRQTVLLPPFNPDIDGFHRSVEHQLIQLTIQQARQEGNVVPNAIFALKEFWKEALAR